MKLKAVTNYINFVTRSAYSAEAVGRVIRDWMPSPDDKVPSHNRRNHIYSPAQIRAAEFVFRSRDILGISNDNNKMHMSPARHEMVKVVAANHGPGWVISTGDSILWVKTPEFAALMVTASPVAIAVPVDFP